MESVASIIRDSTNKQNLNTVKLITLDITLYHSPSSVFTTNSGMKALRMCRTRQIWRAAWLYPSIQRSVDCSVIDGMLQLKHLTSIGIAEQVGIKQFSIQPLIIIFLHNMVIYELLWPVSCFLLFCSAIPSYILLHL